MLICVTGDFKPANPQHPGHLAHGKVLGIKNPIVGAILLGVMFVATAIDQQLAPHEVDVGPGPVPNPNPGQLKQDGTNLVFGDWYAEHGVVSDADSRWPSGPDGTKVPATHVWAPNDGPTNEWVWRPAPVAAPES